MSAPGAASPPQIFVSRPSTLTAAQESLEGKWLAGLIGLGFTPNALPRGDYDPDPWTEIREMVEAADGALILGFRQLRLDRGKWRPETPLAAESSGWLATPWNQLEAGMAIMAGLPVLVVPEEGVTEGIFAGDTWTDQVGAAPIDLWDSPDGAGDPALSGWALAVREHAASAAL